MIERLATVFIASTLMATATPAAAAVRTQPNHPRSWFSNCTEFNKHWPHGVGKNHAHDHTTSTPVTDFKRSTRLYRHAMTINSGLDGDKDGIACESD